MLVLIEKDTNTKVARQVANLAEARALQANGFSVLALSETGETAPLPEDVAEEPRKKIPAKPTKPAAKRAAKKKAR